MSIYLPYTYHIAWTSIDKHYYGVRYAQNCNPKDFWVTYFTSSKLVKEYREVYGEPDIIEIRKTFDDPNKAKRWEYNVLKRLKVLKNERWLNANIGGDQKIIKEHTKESKLKMSLNNPSKRPEIRKIISEKQTGSKNSFYGKKHTEESNNKRREKLIGIKRSEEFKEKHRGKNNHFYGKTHSDETKRKISEKRSKEIFVCPHCVSTIKTKGNAVRWHFDNCKFKSLLPE